MNIWRSTVLLQFFGVTFCTFGHHLGDFGSPWAKKEGKLGNIHFSLFIFIHLRAQDPKRADKGPHINIITMILIFPVIFPVYPLGPGPIGPRAWTLYDATTYNNLHDLEVCTKAYC